MTQAKSRLYGGQSQEHRIAERRAKLMQAALRLYSRLGPAGASVTAICAEAGLTPRYFYESFASREALLAAVFREACDRLVFEVEEALDPADPANSALIAFFAILAEHPQLARFFLVETEHLDAEMREVGRHMLERLSALFMPAAAAPLAKVGAMGAVLRIARFWIEDGAPGQPADPAALARRFVEVAA